MVGTCEPMEDRPVQPSHAVVVYCLINGCDKTTWYGMNHWEISIDRTDGVKSGKYNSMMGPYCPEHRKVAEKTVA